MTSNVFLLSRFRDLIFYRKFHVVCLQQCFMFVLLYFCFHLESEISCFLTFNNFSIPSIFYIKMQFPLKVRKIVRISKLIHSSISLRFALGSFTSDTTLMNVIHCDRLIFDLFAKWTSVLYKIWIQTTK